MLIKGHFFFSVHILIFYFVDLLPKGPQYIGRDSKQVEQQLFQEDTFTSMKFRPPTSTMTSYSNGEKRPESGLSISTLSVTAKTPEPRGKNRVSPEPTHVTENERLASNLSRNLLLPRSPSPNLLYPRSPSPEFHRSHSPFDDADSPLPPVGESLYHGQYITEPIPRTVTPHLPAPSPTPGRQQ